jgi:hypothetical protein
LLGFVAHLIGVHSPWANTDHVKICFGGVDCSECVFGDKTSNHLRLGSPKRRTSARRLLADLRAEEMLGA